MALIEQVKATLLKISGYLVPLLQQIPPLGVYPALMTLPLILYLVALASQFPLSVPLAIIGFIQMSVTFYPIEMILTVGGLALVLFSVVYLYRHRSEGLVTTGPYRFLRHPQYLGFILLTLGLTVVSYKTLKSTFGMGWLTPEGTITLWFAQFTIYIILALIEESYLTKQFGDAYTTYQQQTSFLVPLRNLGKLDIPLSITIISAILFALILLGIPAPIFS